MLKHKAFFDKTTKNITALIFGSINFNEIIFYTTKAQKFFLLTKFSCVKITTVFSRQFNFIEIIFDITKKQKFFRPPKFPVLIDVKAFFNLIDIKFHIATTRNFFKLTKNFQC